jgi:hypothetical protein
MHLNHLAGRTYIDLNQYPVFPWVLSDYTSPALDLDRVESYRDLSKPIGALNPTRLEQFRMRFEMGECVVSVIAFVFMLPVGGEEEENFLYGTHYSSAGAVLYYLIRLEPYTTLFLQVRDRTQRSVPRDLVCVQLQDGHFDHADRMFYAVDHSWRSVLTATSDVKVRGRVCDHSRACMCA